MNDTQLLTLSASLVAALFGILTMILGWLGSKIYSKLEDLSKSLGGIHERINILDRRVTVVETRCRTRHADRGIEQ